MGHLAAAGHDPLELGGHDELRTVTDRFAYADLDGGLRAMVQNHPFKEPQVVDPAHHQSWIAVDRTLGEPFQHNRHGQDGVSVDDVRGEDRQRLEIHRAAKDRLELSFGGERRGRFRRGGGGYASGRVVFGEHDDFDRQ